MKIELLHSPGCNGATAALNLIREVMVETGIDAEVALIPVETEEEAQRLRFVGSPTVRVNDLDVEPYVTFAGQDFGLRCRTYVEDGKASSLPPRRVLRDAVEMGLLAEMDLLGTCC